MKNLRGLSLLLLGLLTVGHSPASGQPAPQACPATPTLAGADAITLPPSLTPSRILIVGRRIWQNECEGKVSGLTSWNRLEAFPSLGIGHFIWYTRDGQERFQESFPGLVTFLRERGAAVPAWLTEGSHCPWPNKAAFDADRNAPKMRELRQLLASTISLQAEYIARRIAAALPVMTATLPEADRALVTDRFHALFATPEGLYALMDYINFKGEGIKETERYAGQGWGLLQVVQGMTGVPQGAEATKAFAASACKVLERRVANAPAERRAAEERFLPGWKLRCRSYDATISR